jgi:simple sugar transport system permease protein
MANVSIELTPRTETPRWFGVAVQAVTVVAALVAAAAILLIVDADPITVYSAMFVDGITDPFQTSRVINRSAPLILAGLAVYIPLRSGLYNIGAEGQLIVGGLVTVWVGTRAPGAFGVGASGPVVLLLSLVAAVLAGIVWVSVPVYLYNKYEVNEILTTLMLVFTAERLSAYLISGPLEIPTGTFPRTEGISFDLPMLPTLFGLELNVGILFALAAVAGTWLLINRTRLGYEVVLAGSNEGVAEQTGINTKTLTFVVFTAAAGLAGLAGFIEVATNQPTLTIGWQPGYGWTAIPIALLGRRGSIQTMFAGVLFAVIFVGGSTVETTLGVPSAISQMIEALLILFLISGEVLRTHRLDLVLGTRSLRESIGNLARASRAEGN